MLCERGRFLSDDVGDTEMGGNKNNLKPKWRRDETRESGGTHTSVRSGILEDVRSREGKPKLKIAQENDDSLESLISAVTIKQLLGLVKSHTHIIALFSCYAWTHEEVRGQMVRIGKQENRAIADSLHTVFRWTSIQRGRIGNGLRIVKSVFTIVFEF